MSEYVYCCHVLLEKRDRLVQGVYGEQVAEGLITEDNERVWREYLNSILKMHLKPEMMETPEFSDAEERVIDSDERLKRYLQKQAENQEARKRRSYISKPRVNFIPKGLKVDYEEEYGKILDNAISFNPANSDDFLFMFRYLERWHKKSIPEYYTLNRPDVAYAVAVELCKHIALLIKRDDFQEYVKRYKSRVKVLILDSFNALVNAVKAWNNEEKRKYVYNFIIEESQQYSEFRGLPRTLIEMSPLDVLVGEPVTVTREMNDEELQEQEVIQLRKEWEANMQIDADEEAKSVIPLNLDYESRVFNPWNISWECDDIADNIYFEAELIEKIAGEGNYMLAALKFMQLTKSMCRHFIIDEHWNYYDDVYSPEYAIETIADFFIRLKDKGKLPIDVQEYLHEAWQEIKQSECCKDYGIFLDRNFF